MMGGAEAALEARLFHGSASILAAPTAFHTSAGVQW
jgi:hypothetical protein